MPVKHTYFSDLQSGYMNGGVGFLELGCDKCALLPSRNSWKLSYHTTTSARTWQSCHTCMRGPALYCLTSTCCLCPCRQSPSQVRSLAPLPHHVSVVMCLRYQLQHADALSRTSAQSHFHLRLQRACPTSLATIPRRCKPSCSSIPCCLAEGRSSPRARMGMLIAMLIHSPPGRQPKKQILVHQGMVRASRHVQRACSN
jgi:hypothetical protein